jgi:hypothetical protein
MRLRKSWHNQSLKAARPPKAQGEVSSITRAATLPNELHDLHREETFITRTPTVTLAADLGVEMRSNQGKTNLATLFRFVASVLDVRQLGR